MVSTHRSFHLARDPAEARQARRHVAEVCGQVPLDVLSTAQLLTSELFTKPRDPRTEAYITGRIG